MKIRVGDEVKVISGDDRGKKGKVKQVWRRKGLVQVEGVALIKKHVKPQSGSEGGIITISRPLPVSKVLLVCPSCSKATRVGIELKGGKRLRLCKKCGATV